MAAPAEVEEEEDEEEEEEEEMEGTCIDVLCPPGVGPGDTLEGRVPKRAGGGRVTTKVPKGAKPGDTFEVYV